MSHINNLYIESKTWSLYDANTGDHAQAQLLRNQVHLMSMKIGAIVAAQGVQARYCVMVLMNSTKAH